MKGKCVHKSWASKWNSQGDGSSGLQKSPWQLMTQLPAPTKCKLCQEFVHPSGDPRAWHPLRCPGAISSCLDRCYHAYISNHIRIHVPLEKLQGQCYDSTSAMSNSKCEVAKRISDLEPWTVYTHCYGYTINLVPSDMFKQSKLMMRQHGTSSKFSTIRWLL